MEEVGGFILENVYGADRLKNIWTSLCNMYVLVRVRLYGGESRPLPFLPPPHSISPSLGIVVPSTGNFSKFCYPVIFIRFKCFLGKGELPNRPAPFMDVCAKIFFYPDFEGGWVH